MSELENAVLRDLVRLDRGVLTEDDYVRVSRVRRDETARLRERESAVSFEVACDRDIAERAARLPLEIGSFVEDFEDLEPTRRKATLQTILKFAYVWNDGRVELEFR